MNVLELRGVTRAYEKGTNVLDNVDLSVAEGEVIGLLGRNGAGKTTLLRIAMGLIEPQAGSVKVLGLDPRLDPLEVKRQIGYVSEDQTLPGFLTMSEAVDLHRRFYPGWDEDLARQLSYQFQMESDRKIKHLSKGQARQVALLCAVCHRPPLLLLDEPAGGLDPAMRREFLETAIQMLGDAGTTILFSSHHMTDVERLASRLVMIHDGQKWIDSDLDDVREGYCLVMAPAASVANTSEILRHPRCLTVRTRGDAVHAVFELEPDEALRVATSDLGLVDARSMPLNLEDMFIELVGGGRS